MAGRQVAGRRHKAGRRDAQVAVSHNWRPTAARTSVWYYPSSSVSRLAGRHQAGDGSGSCAAVPGRRCVGGQRSPHQVRVCEPLTVRSWLFSSPVPLALDSHPASAGCCTKHRRLAATPRRAGESCAEAPRQQAATATPLSPPAAFDRRRRLVGSPSTHSHCFAAHLPAGGMLPTTRAWCAPATA